MEKPCTLVFAALCYETYCGMIKNNIRLIVFYFKNLDIFNIGVSSKNRLFEYICRIKKFKALIFLDENPDKKKLSETRLPKNVIIATESSKKLFAFTENRHFIGMRVNDMFELVKSKYAADTLPCEIIHAFYRLNYEFIGDGYYKYLDNKLINSIFYNIEHKIEHNLVVNISSEYVSYYSPRFFSNFTNETTYTTFTHGCVVPLLGRINAMPLYIVIDMNNMPNIFKFVRCIIKETNIKCYIIIILHDHDKPIRTHIVVMDDSNLILHRYKDTKN